MDDAYSTKFSTRATEIQEVVDDVLERFPNLTTFQEAVCWYSDAKALIRLLDQFCNEIVTYKTEQDEAAKRAEAARASLPFLKRALASRDEENQCRENVKHAENTLISIDEAVIHLQDLLERTPKNKLEQKQMLKDLAQQKKELTTEKRAVNESMRQIRTNSRQKMTNWTGISGKGFTGNLARYERVKIRNQKENALAPQEDAKAAIEKLIIETEKNINRISKIIGDEAQEQQPIIRCAYCGRRVEPGNTCPGCGSDKTVIDI